MSSAKLLASMLEQWSVADNGDQNSLATVIMYLVRVIFKQLLAKRPDNATLCFKFFIDSYNSSLTVVDKAEVEGAPESFQVFKHPLMNFLQLLLVSIERRSVETFKSTKSRYGQVLQQVYPESEKLFVEIGKMYFNIHPQTPMGQLNLNNLLGAMFGGQ